MTAMFAALAFAVLWIVRTLPPLFFVPSMPFLKYEPKDTLIVLCGFILGPLSAAAVSVIVAFLEMITVSDTELIGMIMNAVSSCIFACSAALLYRKLRTASGAWIGLATGVVSTTAFMLFWNYLIVPIYTGYPRSAVVKLLVPVFLPFNLIKYSLSAALIILIYKPLVMALRQTGLVEKSAYRPSLKSSLPAVIGAISLIAVCVTAVFLLGFYK